MRVLWALTLAIALFVSSSASAQALPPDVVQLTNGGMVRGTILENLPGDHVTIQLPTGDTRTFASSEVRSAGPAVMGPAAPPVGYGVSTPPPPPVPPRIHLHVDGPGDLTLQEVTGTATAVVGTGRGFSTISVDAFAPICTAPCDVQVEPRTYRLGVSQGETQPRRADHSLFTLDHDMSVQLEYESREGIRLAGWFVLIGGMVVGAAIALGAWLSGNILDLNETEIDLCIFGGAVFLVSAIAGLIMTGLNDHADIRNLDGTVRF